MELFKEAYFSKSGMLLGKELQKVKEAKEKKKEELEYKEYCRLKEKFENKH